jgi:hypothetical protein
MLREVVLASEDVGCDMQLQHDHLVILGDLNYRMNTSRGAIGGAGAGKQSGLGEGQSVLNSIITAALAERTALGDDPHWVRRKYGLFYGPESPMLIPPEERELLLRAEKVSASQWDSVIQYDEMIEMMKAGEVFFGFREVPPRFPPTYKRKKGSAGDCGDYTSFSELVQGYSHTGEEPNELDDLDDSTRSVSSMSSFSDTSLTGGVTGMRDPDAKSSSTPLRGLDESESGSGGGAEESSEDTFPAAPSPESDEISAALAKSSAPFVEALSESKPKPSRRGSMFNIRRGSVMMGGFDEEKKKEEKRKSKLRPPSYTDRIIVHSLQDNNRLVPQGYGFCDSYRASDHRAVCMTMTLEVCRYRCSSPLTPPLCR